MEEPIHSFHLHNIPIHSLPESLILQCLARLRLKDLPVASRVCREWLRLIGSRHFYALRKQLGFTNQVACLFQSVCLPDCSPPLFCKSKYKINVFDPMNREWNRLPPIPNLTKELTWSTWIASSEGKLVVFSDYGLNRDPVKSVFVLDFATQRWRKGQNMPLITRSKFSMAASQCQRIFISSDLGRNKGTVWEYDVWKDEWTLFHQVRGGEIIRIRVVGEELWVILGFRGMKELGADVYHLQTEKWRRVELTLVRYNELLFLQPDLELYEFMKKLCENDFFKVLKDCFRLQLGKRNLLMAPTVKVGGCDGEVFFYMQDQDGNLERMQPPSSEFSKNLKSCYCVEL